MLLIGAIPLPFGFGTATMSETIPAAPKKAWPSPDAAAAERAVKSAERVSDPTIANNVAAAPGRVATVSVRAPQVDAPQSVLDAAEVERMTKRGEDYLAQGDLAAARLILARAAEARDPRAAFSLGATYDPAVHKQLRVVGAKPDVGQARAWYAKAAAYGSDEASRRLAELPNLEP
jgi:TPR repeat protein